MAELREVAVIGAVPVFVPPAPRPGVPLHCRRCEVYGAIGETVCWVCDQPAPTERTRP